MRGIRDALAGVGFARLYGSFGDVLHTDGEIIARSARRYLEALETMD